jgi:putative transposase
MKEFIMGRSRFKIFENSSPYFITSTIIEWMPLFSIPKIAGIIIDTLNFMIKNDRIEIFGYVIMENHIHLIVQSENLNKEIADFKSFTARKTIDYLKEYHYVDMLKKLEFFKLSQRTDRNYQVWQEGVHPEQIINRKIMIEKLEYIHNNPLRRGYIDEAVHWRYSSARNYGGFKGVIEINMDWM